jgi:hypothetical protein
MNHQLKQLFHFGLECAGLFAAVDDRLFHGGHCWFSPKITIHKQTFALQIWAVARFSSPQSRNPRAR